LPWTLKKVALIKFLGYDKGNKYQSPGRRENMYEPNKWHGGAREGAGRPKIGEKRVLGLTLPDDVWKFVESVMYDQDMNQTEALRYIIEKAKIANDEFMKTV